MIQFSIKGSGVKSQAHSAAKAFDTPIIIGNYATAL